MRKTGDSYAVSWKSSQWSWKRHLLLLLLPLPLLLLLLPHAADAAAAAVGGDDTLSTMMLWCRCQCCCCPCMLLNIPLLSDAAAAHYRPPLLCQLYFMKGALNFLPRVLQSFIRINEFSHPPNKDAPPVAILLIFWRATFCSRLDCPPVDCAVRKFCKLSCDWQTNLFGFREKHSLFLFAMAWKPKVEELTLEKWGERWRKQTTEMKVTNECRGSWYVNNSTVLGFFGNEYNFQIFWIIIMVNVTSLIF